MPVFSKNKTPRRYNRKRVRNSIIALIAVIILFGIVLIWQTYQIYQTDLPSFTQLHNIEPNLKTKVFDRNGDLLKEFYSENRALTPFSDMPEPLIEMLMATEDREFYDHWGINVRRAAIVAVNNLLKMEIEAGASTITQQLSRMLFLNRRQTLERKIKEALTAIKLERTYSKNEILEMYLNQYYFSRGAYGIAAASHLFFDKQPSELDLNDCAIIIGLLKGPNINSPLNNPDKALQARNRVLHSYLTYGAIDRPTYDSLRSQPLEISPPKEEAGTAPFFTEWVRQHILETYGEDVLYSGGLKVYTTLDAGLQAEAEAALEKQLAKIQERIENTYSLNNTAYTETVPDTVDEFGDPIRQYKQIQGAQVAIDNSNGDIVSLIGGRNWETTKYNRAVQGTGRPPGSAFKPFIYTAAVDNGFRTTEIIDDNPIVLDIPGAKQWRPHNYDSKFLGPITLRDGIRLSRNLVAIRLMLRINPEEPIFYARRMGITTPLEPVPSLALGVSDVRPVELVSAYSTFPNQGIHIPYRFIYKIVDRYGRVLEDNTAIRKEEVLSAQTAYIMVDLMKSVVESGTGRGARWRGFTRPAGGKTGTSQSFCDNWFVGYTPQITSGVWIGFDDRTSIGRGQDGATNGVPVWTQFMLAAHDTLPIREFEEPEGLVHLDVCLESGELATDRCVNVRNEIFTVDNQPTNTCHIHPSKGLYVPHTRADDLVPEDTTDERTHF
ncbi:PBP1A family penicillin-binding protein [candidate division GN15 bacterium]|nr:PBP1A family penicillin-binding protein [candidate division GN15 bacterium]